MKRALAGIVALLFFAVPSHSQEVRKHHRVVDKKFILAVGLAVAATVADVETTARCVKLHACLEGNPIYGPRPSRLRMYAINAPVTSATVLFAYYMKHERMNKTFWIPLAPVTALHGYAAIRNFQYANRIERHCPTGFTCTFQ